MTTVTCNKMFDHILESFQEPFTRYMDHYKIPKMAPIKLGHWGRISLHDGKINKFGKLCRSNDFKVVDQGDNCYMIKGEISLPEPRGEFKADAYLYNRFKVRNRSIRLAAKEVRFEVMMNVDKESGRVHVAELEPVGISGFHLEDGHSRSARLVWPFSRINKQQLELNKYVFMRNIQHELCDQFRTMVHKPKIQQLIIEQV